MDILKARKKAKEAKERGGGGGEDLTAPTPPPVSVPPVAPPRAIVEAESSPVERPAQPPRPAGGAAVGDRVRTFDPLREFLACYDDGVAPLGHDEEGEVRVEEEKRFLSFSLAGEAYAASIMDIREILKFVALTEVPRARGEVLGVLSKRGLVMPIVDLAAILGLRPPDRRADREQRVLVAGEGDRICGMRVDQVHEVVRLHQRVIEEVPSSLGAKNAHMLLGLGRARLEGTSETQMLILLDVPAVLATFAEAMGIDAGRLAGGGDDAGGDEEERGRAQGDAR